MKIATLVAGLGLLAGGCATYQTVSPVEALDSVARMEAGQGTLFCVIDSQSAATPYMESLQAALVRRSFEVKVLPPYSSIAACPLTATYTANRQSYWRPYLVSADLTIYRNGDRVGRASYDALRSAGGLNLSNWVEPEAKIEELVDRLFPGLRPLPAAAPDGGTAPAPADPAQPAGATPT
ncbi:hypothetical protein K6V92_07370 [Cupriavidus respiraculi]|uniref:Sbal_3080 family lipoprotein n=1 Tax=Cupriavidus respiraculi TaxID=195930 RepID=UPI001C95C683|nr:Sbal_3080 family lipoprotein [Cupriavidus respiraculi]MBY4946442.1 hypothetical protein [Cupriavidus respiraculi]